MRKLQLTILSLLLVFVLACDGLIAGFRAGLAASKPIVQTLVSRNVITQAKADLVTRDIGDGVDAMGRGDACIKAITVSGSAKRIAKAKCYYQAAQDLRVILSRHNIGGNDILDTITAIVSAAIEAFEIYHTSVNTGAEVTGSDGGILHTGADGISGENADKSLEATMKDLKKQLDDLKKQSE